MEVDSTVTVYDVPPRALIEALAKYLRERHGSVIRPPGWAAYVKTSCHKERLPQDSDWWYVRAASIMRKLYVRGPIGVGRLRTAYGGRAMRGSEGEHFKKGGGNIIRNMLQQLEEAGFVAKEAGRGRKLTPRGRSLLDRTATRVFKSLVKEMPELRKYASP